MKLGVATSKYLDRYAESEVRLAGEIPGEFEEVVVIPSYGEGCETARALASIPTRPKGRILVIVVLNARSGSPQWVHEANALTRAALIAQREVEVLLAQGAQLLPHPSGQLLLIDRASDDRFLPERQGVGLARKIGADVAAALIARGVVRSPWIHCTDADARLPGDYFEKLDFEKIDTAQQAGTVALLHPFHHQADPATERGRAVLQYEVSLRYYVLGLRYAGSPYAYHSIGSTISVHARAYAEVRGFPRRRAAEDFYLLNKLAKVGNIESLRGTAIELSGRESERVPFGTGRAIRDALAQDAERRSVDSLELYDPAVFSAFRAWIRTLDAFAQDEKECEPRALLARFQDPTFDVAALEACLDEVDAFAALKHASAHRRTRRDVRKHLHDHFDAFRFLKLAHALRDRAHPSLPLRDALARAPFLEIDPGAPLPVMCEELAALEQERT